MKHILIILSLFLFTSPLFGQSSKPLGVVLPPTVMGNVSNSRKQILLNTLDDELSQYFDVSPSTNDGSGKLPVVSDVFQLQIIEEDGDTQLSVRWMSGNERKIETIFCGGCKTIELNGKLEGLVGKLVGKRNVKKKPVVNKKRQKIKKPDKYWVNPKTGYRLNLSEMDRRMKKEECMEVAKLLPADDRLKYLRECVALD